MTPREEQQQQETRQAQSVTQEDIKLIKQDVNKLFSTLNEVHQAIVGSNIGKDGGLVQRIFDLEKYADVLETRVLTIEKKKIKLDLHVKVLWGGGGAILLAFIIWVLNQLHIAERVITS